MLIFGDIASPNLRSSTNIYNFLLENRGILNDESILFNLEGLITDDNYEHNNTPILYNHTSILDVFSNYTNKVAALANNHTLDLPHKLNSSKHILNKSGFRCVGAGKKSDIDFFVNEIIDNNQKVLVINACWDFLLYHQNNTDPSLMVNVIDEFEILSKVKQMKLNYPSSKIITYFHWSFDLEILPSPSYRLFAKDLIDSGVSLVVGCHSHCVQGGEKYKNGYIVYGLGNFYIPSGFYANGELKFPSMSNIGLILKWDILKNNLKNIWVDSSNNYLKLIRVEDFEHSPTLNKFSGYSGLAQNDYAKYFKKNRRKKKLNPIFYDYKTSFSNKVKMRALKSRARIARLAAKLNLISWQN